MWPIEPWCGNCAEAAEGGSMTTTKKILLAWKYRRAIWKWRKLYRYRREIGGLAVVGIVQAVTALVPHRAK